MERALIECVPWNPEEVVMSWTGWMLDAPAFCRMALSDMMI